MILDFKVTIVHFNITIFNEINLSLNQTVIDIICKSEINKKKIILIIITDKLKCVP